MTSSLVHLAKLNSYKLFKAGANHLMISSKLTSFCLISWMCLIEFHMSTCSPNKNIMAPAGRPQAEYDPSCTITHKMFSSMVFSPTKPQSHLVFSRSLSMFPFNLSYTLMTFLTTYLLTSTSLQMTLLYTMKFFLIITYCALRTDLKQLTSCAQAWQMDFNVTKCYIMSITTKTSLILFLYNSETVSPPMSTTASTLESPSIPIWDWTNHPHSSKVLQNSWTHQKNTDFCNLPLQKQYMQISSNPI